MRIRDSSLAGRFCESGPASPTVLTPAGRLGLSALSGFSIALGSPAGQIPLLGFVALVPLTLAVLAATKVREAFVAGFLAYGVASLVCLDFLRDVLVSGAGVSGPLAALAVTLLAIVFAAKGGLFAVLLHLLVRGGRSRWLSIVLALVSSELMPAPIPWSMGALLLDAPWWSLAALLGSIGISLVLAIATAAFVTLLTEGPRNAAPFFLASLLARVTSSAGLSDDPKATLEVGMVTTEIPRGQALSLADIAERAMKLERAGARIVVLPEAAIPGEWTDEDLRATLGHALDGVGIPVVVGAIMRSHEAHTPLWNSAVEVAPNEAWRRYDKRRLVPLSEGSDGMFGKLARRLGYTELGEYRAGTRTARFTADGKSIEPAICFEGLFSESFHEPDENGSVLLNLVNDGWLDARGDRLHARLTQVRSVEMGRALVRVANGGESYVVDADGRALTSGKGDLLVSVPSHAGRTIYSKFGDTWVYGVAIVTLGLALRKRPTELTRSSAPS